MHQGAGVLRDMQAGEEKLFIHPRLMQLLGQNGNKFAPYPQQFAALQSSVIFADEITFAQRVCSPAMYVRNCAGPW
ncbi:hypothetical protein BH11PSE7_BH11PSE7_03590 [soil metagenome]